MKQAKRILIMGLPGAGKTFLAERLKNVLTEHGRITGSGATFAISYIVLGDFAASGAIALIQLTCNTILYFVHERVWNFVRWGRR